jgi:hypothetical protein
MSAKKGAFASGLAGRSIPVVMKKDAWKKDVLICQNHDESLNFAGDSGAVGTPPSPSLICVTKLSSF